MFDLVLSKNLNLSSPINNGTLIPHAIANMLFTKLKLDYYSLLYKTNSFNLAVLRILYTYYADAVELHLLMRAIIAVFPEQYML